MTTNSLAVTSYIHHQQGY